MSSKGEGIKRELKLNRRQARESLKNISKPSIRRLARRGGVKRLGSAVYGEMRVALHQYLTKILLATTMHTDHAKRQIVSVEDVLQALRIHGQKLYGF